MDFATHNRDIDVGQCQIAGKYKCTQPRELCVEGSCPLGVEGPDTDGLCANGMRAQSCGPDDMDSDGRFGVAFICFLDRLLIWADRSVDVIIIITIL